MAPDKVCTIIFASAVLHNTEIILKILHIRYSGCGFRSGSGINTEIKKKKEVVVENDNNLMLFMVITRENRYAEEIAQLEGHYEVEN